MRIILFASGDLWGGAEEVVYQLASHMSKDPKIHLNVILLNDGQLADTLRTIGLKVYVVKENNLTNIALLLAVRNEIKLFSPDIIHSHGYKANSFSWMASRCLGNIKLVATQHGMPEIVGPSKAIIARFKSNMFFWILSNHFDLTVMVSEEIKSSLIGSFGFNLKNTCVIRNGVPSIFKKNRCLGRQVKIGSAGRLFPIKDFSLLVDVAQNLALMCKDVSFCIAGDGPEHMMLKNKISSYGLKHSIILLGHQYDMDGFYSDLDIYVNTSIHEGIPMTILEAMAHGLPIIAPKVGGISEIIEDGVEGFLIDSRDPQDYAEKCLLLYRDRELWRKMSIAARKKVCSKFSSEQMTEHYLKCYRELVE